MRHTASFYVQFNSIGRAIYALSMLLSLLGMHPLPLTAQDCIAMRRAQDGVQTCVNTLARVTIALKLDCHADGCTEDSNVAVVRLNSLLRQHSPTEVQAFAFVPDGIMTPSKLMNLFYDWHMSFPLYSGQPPISQGAPGGPQFLALDEHGHLLGSSSLGRSAASLAFFLDSLTPRAWQTQGR